MMLPVVQSIPAKDFYGLEKLPLIPSVPDKQETLAKDPTGSMAMYTTPHSSENTSQDIKPTKYATKADCNNCVQFQKSKTRER